jgi:hypothetical protein
MSLIIFSIEAMSARYHSVSRSSFSFELILT